MKGTAMGHVTVTIKVENYVDWVKARTSKNKKKPRVRTIIVPDALVDTGATHLSLPSRFIEELGLVQYPTEVRAETANGTVTRKMFGGAWLTIDGRSEECAVIELPDSAPALIGVIPLEGLDFIVDPIEQKLVGKHGRKRVCLLY